MKISVDSASVDVTAKFSRQGSVLGYTVEAGCAGVELHLRVKSDEPRERIAGLLRNAEAGCYVMQALRNPTPVSATYELNGSAIQAVAPTAS